MVCMKMLSLAVLAGAKGVSLSGLNWHRPPVESR
jgi:hypothetical protein